MKKIQLFIFLICITFISCNSDSSDKHSDEAVSGSVKENSNFQLGREDLVNSITDNEKKLLKNAAEKEIDKMGANAIISLYDNFIKSYPQDSLVPSYLFKEGELSLVVKNYEKAATCFHRIYTEFQGSSKVTHALFMHALVCDNYLNEDNKAGELYREFLKKYPKHELSQTVKFSLQNLGKSDEQLIKEFEKKNRK